MVPTQHMLSWLQAVADRNPGQRGDRRSPPALGQSEPVCVAPRPADATPRRRVAGLVGADPRRGGAARIPVYPAPDNRIATTCASHGTGCAPPIPAPKARHLLTAYELGRDKLCRARLQASSLQAGPGDSADEDEEEHRFYGYNQMCYPTPPRGMATQDQPSPPGGRTLRAHRRDHRPARGRGQATAPTVSAAGRQPDRQIDRRDGPAGPITGRACRSQGQPAIRPRTRRTPGSGPKER